MKAITIHQPWATLIDIGEKRFETRSWRTLHKGPIAIHAGQKIDRKACMSDPIRSTLAKHGFNTDNLPTGAIIAVVDLKYCHEIGVVEHRDGIANFKWTEGCIWGNEFHFGWYEYGRYAWELADVKQIEPIPTKGQQGLWNWEKNLSQKIITEDMVYGNDCPNGKCEF